MKISKSELISIIKQNVDPQVKVNDIKPEDILADIGIDSLGFATVLWCLEDRFNVQINDEYLESLNTLSTVSDLIAIFEELGHEISVDTA